MAGKSPKTIPDYIRAAPKAGQPHLRRLHEILESVAPEAEQTMKWNTPFFIEPRFLFAYSACKSHVNFAPMAVGLDPFRKELKKYKTTANFLQIPYSEPLPEALIRKIAKRRVRDVKKREDYSFW